MCCELKENSVHLLHCQVPFVYIGHVHFHICFFIYQQYSTHSAYLHAGHFYDLLKIHSKKKYYSLITTPAEIGCQCNAWYIVLYCQHAYSFLFIRSGSQNFKQFPFPRCTLFTGCLHTLGLIKSILHLMSMSTDKSLKHGMLMCILGIPS